MDVLKGKITVLINTDVKMTKLDFKMLFVCLYLSIQLSQALVILREE